MAFQPILRGEAEETKCAPSTTGSHVYSRNFFLSAVGSTAQSSPARGMAAQSSSIKPNSPRLPTVREFFVVDFMSGP